MIANYNLNRLSSKIDMIEEWISELKDQAFFADCSRGQRNQNKREKWTHKWENQKSRYLFS